MSEKTDEDKNVRLHKEVASGLAQVVFFYQKFLENSSINRISLSKICEAGCKGRDKKAGEYINKFLKNGGLTLPQDGEIFYEVTNGDYAKLWEVVNEYLESFGHEKVEPVELSLNF